MTASSFAETARILGYRSDGMLRRLRDQGALDDYLGPGSRGLVLDPPGLPSLRDHLAKLLKPAKDPRRRVLAPRESAEGSTKERAATALVGERALLTRLQRQQLEGTLVDRGEVRRLLFSHVRVARDRINAAAPRIAAAVVAITAGDRHRIEAAVIEELTAALADLSRDPLPQGSGS